MGASPNDEWWRHDSGSSRDSGGSYNSGNSFSNTPRQSTSSSANQQDVQTNSYSHASNYEAPRYSNSDTVAPWREKDRTAHLDAMRSKRNSRARKSQNTAYRRTNRSVPQFKDTTARHGGWDFPSLNRGGNKRNSGTSSSIFGTGRPDTSTIILIVAAVLALLLVFFVLRGIVGCVGGLISPAPETEAAATEEAATEGATDEQAVTNGSGTTSGVSFTVLDEGRTTASGMGRMSFSAVGDNLMNANLLTLADSWAGSEGDGEYDFSPFYTEIKDYIQNQCDVSFINQETTLGGTDNFDYMGYPSYNSPDSLADAVAEVGWRIVNTNSNHTYDTWTDSIVHAQEVWNAKTSLVTVGSYSSEADRNTIRTVECNGIRVAILSYSYGQNGYEQSDLPNDYYAVPYSEDDLKTDVANAQKVADATIVYLHFGTEYTNEANDEQKAIAQVCADNGVDVVIGSHAHVIQPVEWIERPDGSKMLCAYGLGDFVAGYTGRPETIMSGMITFDFVRTGDASTDEATTDEAQTSDASSEAAMSYDTVGPGGIAVTNVVWHPLIEHMEGTTDTVRFVSNYTDEEARANELLSTLDDPLGWIKETTQDVIGDAVTIDM